MLAISCLSWHLLACRGIGQPEPTWSGHRRVYGCMLVGAQPGQHVACPSNSSTQTPSISRLDNSLLARREVMASKEGK